MVATELLHQAFGFIVVAALWGCTNPFLKRAGDESAQAAAVVPKDGAADGETKDTRGSTRSGVGGAFVGLFTQLVATMRNWKFFVPFILNQSGSVVFYYLLGTMELSLAVPICNSLTFVFTAVTGWLLGEKGGMGPSTAMGSLLVVVGVAICLQSKTAELGDSTDAGAVISDP